MPRLQLLIYERHIELAALLRACLDDLEALDRESGQPERNDVP